MRFFRRSLIALGVAAILPTVLFSAVVLFYLLRAEGNRVEADTLSRSRDVMNLVDARLKTEVAALQVLSTSSYLDSRDWPNYYPRLKYVWSANPEWATVVLYDARTQEVIIDMRRQFSAPRPATLPGGLDSRSLAGASETLISGPIKDDDSGEYFIYLHMPVRREQQVAYVFTIALRPQVFQDILLSQIAEGTVAAVVDRNGNFVARSLDYQERIGKPATQFVRDALGSAPEGLYRGKTYEGLENYTAFHVSPWSGWSAHVAVPSSLIDRPVSWSLIVAGIAGLGCVLLGGVLAVLVLRDMAERRRAEDMLRQSQKMEAVGQLTGGIAHDFNNLLTAVIGNLDMIRSRASADERLRRLADNALEAARRGAKLTTQLLAFSRNQRMKLAPVELARVLEAMSGLLHQSVGPSIEIKTDIDPKADVVLSDANQLELALLNLAVNARDAMPDGGALSISSCVAHHADVRQLPSRPYVELRVTDTGVGMSETVRARAMEPFFTTKRVGQGTGLGLSQVYGVVRESGGMVLLQSEENRGTTVRLILPAATLPAPVEDHVANPGPATVPAARIDQEKVILVVDDDRQVRRFIVESLRTLQYRVLEAGGGEEALNELERTNVDLLVVDFAMPGMNGAELARAAQKKWSDLPILMVSGYADSAAVEAAIGPVQLLRKPFDLAELGSAVAEVLKKRAGFGG